MSNWKKKDKYHAISGQYTMSWLDNKRFTLYFLQEHLISGTRDECMDEYYRHFNLPAEYKKQPKTLTGEQFQKAHNNNYKNSLAAQ